MQGSLRAQWQRDLFGGIDTELCTFEVNPTTQTIPCRICRGICQLDAADVWYRKGVLSADQVRQDICFRTLRRDETRTAEGIVKEAITGGTAQG